MGFFDALFGRSKPAKPDLDRLFALPSASITLEAALGFAPTGLGSVCFRAAEGRAFAETQRQVQDLLDADQGPQVQVSTDFYGFTWLLARHPADNLSGLVTDIHAVNSTLQGAGFGPSLLCSLVGFDDGSGRRLALVYRYKSGTFYPFAPRTGERRDNALELQVRGTLADDLRIEPELDQWFPVWGAPGL